jgi:hypothetical protein
MNKEYKVLMHGNLNMLEKHVNDHLNDGWNILGYINYLNGSWIQTMTRTTE